jgi:hypothetical protein
VIYAEIDKINLSFALTESLYPGTYGAMDHKRASPRLQSD